MDGEDVQPVKQVLAKLPGLDPLFEVAVCRRDNPRVHANRMRAAEPFDLPLQPRDLIADVAFCDGGTGERPDAVGDAAARIAGLLATAPDGITIGQVREVLGTTRKWAVPLLGHLDATGVTRRRGDLHHGIQGADHVRGHLTQVRL